MIINLLLAKKASRKHFEKTNTLITYFIVTEGKIKCLISANSNMLWNHQKTECHCQVVIVVTISEWKLQL